MWYLILLGIVVLLITSYDILWTILSATVAGPVSRWIMKFYKQLARFIPKKAPFIHNVIRSIGLFTFLTSILIWYFLFWFGWALIFIAVETSVISSATFKQTDAFEKIYYIGYMIFTAGLGDYKPVGFVFQLLSVLANATGIILVTITVAYLLSATNAVTRQRQMAGHISALGRNPISILLNAWNGQDFKSLQRPLSHISGEITVCAQQLLRFPLIFNFHSIETDYATSIRLTTLDEMITILQTAIPREFQPEPLVLIQCKRAIDQYLVAVELAVGIRFDKEVTNVPVPSLQDLELHHIPMVPHSEWRANIQKGDVAKRRRSLYKMVVDSTRRWEELYEDGGNAN